MKQISFTIVLSLSLFAWLSSFAGEETKVGFSKDGVPKSWNDPKGEWITKDGALHGKELESDKHAAVLAIPAAHSDSSIQFRFQLNGAKGFHLSYNHAKGHLFRVRAGAGKVTLAMDKDKKDPTSKAVTLQDAKIDFEAGKWYDMSCTVKGTKVEVTVGDQKLSGTHPYLSKGKTGFRFIVQGESVVIDDVAYSTAE